MSEINDQTYYRMVLLSANRLRVWRHTENSGAVGIDHVHEAALACNGGDIKILECLCAADTQGDTWHWERLCVEFKPLDPNMLLLLKQSHTNAVAKRAIQKLSEEEREAIKETGILK